MAISVKIRDVVEAIDLPSEDWHAYLNRDTGEIVTVTDEERRLVEDGEIPDDLPAWQQQTLPKTREALGSDRFVMLPGRFEVHEWSIMEEFAREQPGHAQADDLLDAVHGSGAFRMFRSTLRRLGLEDDWYRFRASALADIAKDWLDTHGIAHT